MSATNPLATIWAELELGGYAPHGKPYDFRSRCPGHDGDNSDALHVYEGADRRVLVHCFAHGCEVERITARLGMNVRDLFPAGHYRAQKRRLKEVRRSDLTGNAQAISTTLAALDTLEIPWTAMVMTTCVYCGGMAWLRTTSGGEPYLDCSEGCTSSEFLGALAGRVRDLEAAA